MFDVLTKRKFLFKCDDCGVIISFDFQEESDLKDIQEDKLILECGCQGKCKVLRD